MSVSGVSTGSSANTGVNPTNTGVISFAGIGSGFNYSSIIQQLTAVSQEQEVPYQNKVTTVTAQNNEVTKISGLLSSLQSSLKALSDTNTYNSYSATPADTSIVTLSPVTGSSAAVPGTYTISSTTLGTATSVAGLNSIGKQVYSTLNGVASDTSTVPLVDSYVQITPTNGGIGAGTVTINGVKVSYDVNSQSLDTILSNIQSAVRTGTGDTSFTISYNGNSDDKVDISSTEQPISLGAPGDTGNLLTVLKLDTAKITNTSSSGSVSSSYGVGGVNPYVDLTGTNAQGNSVNANLNTTVTAGSFTINGVSFTVTPSTQSLNDVITAINESSAGVVASFSTQTGQLTLTNKTAGAQALVLSDGTSNFLNAVGLVTGNSVTSGPSSINQASLLSGTVTAGTFSINGVSFTVDPTTESLSTVIAAINASAAGATASFDAATGQTTLTDNTAGTSLTLASGTSDFLTAIGLSPTTTLGTQASLSYTDTSGTSHTVYSNSNTVTGAIPGFSVDILKTDASGTTVNVAQSATAAETAINTFVTAYNNTVNELNSALAAPVVTGSGNTAQSVGGGVLFGNSIAEQLKNKLVSLVSDIQSSTVSGYESLAAIGLKLDSTFQTLSSSSSGTSVSGTSNTALGNSGISVQTYQGTDGALQPLDTTTFEAAFAANPNAIANIFTNSSNFVTQLGTYLTDETGLSTILATGIAGTAPTQSVLGGLQSQNQAIISEAQKRIAQIQAQITQQANQLNTEFTASSQTIQELQQEQSYLSAIGGSSSSSSSG